MLFPSHHDLLVWLCRAYHPLSPRLLSGVLLTLPSLAASLSMFAIYSIYSPSFPAFLHLMMLQLSPVPPLAAPASGLSALSVQVPLPVSAFVFVSVVLCFLQKCHILLPSSVCVSARFLGRTLLVPAVVPDHLVPSSCPIFPSLVPCVPVGDSSFPPRLFPGLMPWARSGVPRTCPFPLLSSPVFFSVVLLVSCFFYRFPAGQLSFVLVCASVTDVVGICLLLLVGSTHLLVSDLAGGGHVQFPALPSGGAPTLPPAPVPARSFDLGPVVLAGPLPHPVLILPACLACMPPFATLHASSTNIVHVLSHGQCDLPSPVCDSIHVVVLFALLLPPVPNPTFPLLAPNPMLADLAEVWDPGSGARPFVPLCSVASSIPLLVGTSLACIPAIPLGFC